MNLSQRAKDHLTKPIYQTGEALLSCWPGLSKRLPKYKPVAVALGYSTEAEGIFLLLKIPCTSETEPRDPLHCN